MTHRSDDLAPIITLAQRNDPAAYEQLYHRFVDPLFRYLCARCDTPTQAEELLSELWLRVVQNLPKFRVPAQGADQAFTSWLYRIAHNISVDAARKANDYMHEISEMVESPEPLTEDSVLAQDERRMLVQALRMLTADQREVIQLRFHEDRTISEVAALTGRTETAIKGLQHRALGALARAMGLQQRREGFEC
ncbi:MAG TPA: sigma-70 family RNA polymerase sigma factor [Roseiflexaceae bacterium]